MCWKKVERFPNVNGYRKPLYKICMLNNGVASTIIVRPGVNTSLSYVLEWCLAHIYDVLFFVYGGLVVDAFGRKECLCVGVDLVSRDNIFRRNPPCVINIFISRRLYFFFFEYGLEEV